MPQTNIHGSHLQKVHKRKPMSNPLANGCSSFLGCLRSLPPDCYFNIHGFGTRHVSLFPKSMKSDVASLGQASAHTDSVEVDLGCTDILTPLNNIYGPIDVITPGGNSTILSYQRKVRNSLKGTVCLLFLPAFPYLACSSFCLFMVFALSPGN